MNALLELYWLPPLMLALFFFGSLFLMRACGNPLIAWLKALKGTKWSPREDTPDSHLQKAGVPSMGGLGIIGSAFVGYAAVMLFSLLAQGMVYRDFSMFSLQSGLIYLLFPAVVGLHCVLGFIDDWSKAHGTGGISSRAKLAGQLVLGVGFLLILAFTTWRTQNGFLSSNLAIAWWLLSLLIIVGTSNAVNLTDGIDGLAAGLSVQCAASFAVVVVAFNRYQPSADFSFPVLFFWLCLGGACLGFLAFNKHPAKVFMGDTGSLALGAALGAGAILTGTVWLLPFIGFIFFVEMFSVIIQVSYFKYTKKKTGEGKRVFRRAPLHHHFELGGWSEWRVVGTFWAINLVTSCIGLALLKMGYLPTFP
jgi:phospho-N-acetylmuramoyl-pentapeptide-transferase